MHKSEPYTIYVLFPLRAAQVLWGSLASCAPVAYRRFGRVANPPQAASLPHTDAGPMPFLVAAQLLNATGRPNDEGGRG
jgi:hypothetical protein